MYWNSVNKASPEVGNPKYISPLLNSTKGIMVVTVLIVHYSIMINPLSKPYLPLSDPKASSLGI